VRHVQLVNIGIQTSLVLIVHKNAKLVPALLLVRLASQVMVYKVPCAMFVLMESFFKFKAKLKLVEIVTQNARPVRISIPVKPVNLPSVLLVLEFAKRVHPIITLITINVSLALLIVQLVLAIQLVRLANQPMDYKVESAFIVQLEPIFKVKLASLVHNIAKHVRVELNVKHASLVMLSLQE